MMVSLKPRYGGLTALVLLALVVIALGLIAATVYLLTYQARGLADAFRPRVDSEVVLSGAIESLQAEGKLVVLTADVWAEARSSTSKAILFGLIDLGETSARVRAPARVQYVLSLEEVDRDDFTFDPEGRRLIVAVPNPRLDTTIVEVSADPADLEVERTIGWMRLDAFSGKYNENRARSFLRQAALRAGASGYWLSEAQRSAEEELRRLLAPMIDVLRDDVTLIIAFHDDQRPAPEQKDLPRPRAEAY